MYQDLALLSAFAFVYSTLARGVERTPVNGALVFVGFGFLAGSRALGMLQIDVQWATLRNIAEITLALTLFTDAANANLRVLWRNYGLPRRLLCLALPLSILLGFLCGLPLLGELDFWELALLATMLAPTDAALGRAVIANRQVPAEIRETLNVESGLNDGICVPVLYLFLALAVGAEAPVDRDWQWAAGIVLGEIGIGLVVGLSVTLAGSWLLRWSARRHWVRGHWQPVHTLSLAVTCFATAQWAGGSGFIAAFAGGLLFDVLVTRHKESLLAVAESAGEVLALVTWVLFGASVVGLVLEVLTWQIVLYAVLSLTLVRMLPVCLALRGSGLDLRSKLFVGWFGPRGLASIVFAVIVIAEPLEHTATLGATVACTVLLSVIAHGLSANPLVRSFGRYRRRQRAVSDSSCR